MGGRDIGVLTRAASRLRRDWVGVVAVLSLAIFAGLALSRILYRYDVGEYEANAWAPASLLAHFHDPYSQSLTVHPPFIASAYGPVYYAVVGLGLRLCGDQFWFARSLALVAGLLSAVLVFRISWRFAHDRFTALLGSALLLAQYPMLSWAGVQRPDLLALAFVLLGLNLALRPRGYRRAWHPACSALALVAAVLTRQTYVIPFAVVAAWYLLERDIGALWLFLATVAGVGGAIVGVLWISSDGGLITNLITNQARAASSVSELTSHLRALAESPVTWLTVILVVSALATVARRAAGGRADPSRAAPPAQSRLAGLLLAYCGLATVLALLTGSHTGSNINYFIEPLAVASLLVGVAGSDVLQLRSGAVRLAILAILSAGVVVIGVREAHGQLLRWRAKPYFDEIVADVRRMPARAGPMYSDYPELVVLAGRTAYVNDFVQYDGRSLAMRRAFDRLLASEELAAIISARSTAPPGYVQVKLRHARPVGVYSVNLYVRRGIALIGHAERRLGRPG